MNEKYGNQITRDRIEKMLMEATGFKGDIAAIDAVFVVVETWAAQMAEGLSASPDAVREAHLHLLVQQAELLLDSAGRIASAVQLSEQVTFLAGLTEGMSLRMDGIAAEVRDRSLTPREASDEITRLTEGWDDEIPVMPTEGAILTEPDRNVLAEWEADLIAGKLPAAADTLPKPKRFKAPAIEDTPAGPVLQCTGCGSRKRANTDNFFRNAKSSTGFESRCRTCRSARKAA